MVCTTGARNRVRAALAKGRSLAVVAGTGRDGARGGGAAGDTGDEREYCHMRRAAVAVAVLHHARVAPHERQAAGVLRAAVGDAGEHVYERWET
jgi:hypothetical protein